MLITAVTSTPPERAATPEVVEREAKPAPESKREAEPRARVKSTPAPERTPVPERPSQYNLVYDKELRRTFVQVVNRESGEEILRFPSEELVRFIDDTVDRDPAEVSPGLLVDRSV